MSMIFFFVPEFPEFVRCIDPHVHLGASSFFEIEN